MEKLSLIFDRVYNISYNIKVAESDKKLRLLLKNKLDSKVYTSINELINNTFIAIDTDNRRYLINKNGDIIKSWEYTKNKDIINIGLYLDSLDIKDILKGIIRNKLIIRAKDGYNSYNIELKIDYINKETNTYIVSITDNIAENNIQSLIVNNTIEYKFIRSNKDYRYIVNKIEVINNKLRYIENYTISDEIKYISSGIYTNKRLISLADNYKKYNNLIFIWINNIKSDTHNNLYKIIYNNRLKRGEYKFIGIGDNKLYLQDYKTSKYKLYNLETLEEYKVKKLEVLNRGYAYRKRRLIRYELMGEEKLESVDSIL